MDLLQVEWVTVSCGIASMRTLFQVLAIGAVLLLDAGSASAADCVCDRLSAEGCSQGATVFEEPVGPPLWCERADDPRCMPASSHGTSSTTLAPLVMSWAQPVGVDAPPGVGVRVDLYVAGDARTEHSRRVDRPPR
jgi:hypothetical protein